jgi:hypothetical protein
LPAARFVLGFHDRCAGGVGGAAGRRTGLLLDELLIRRTQPGDGELGRRAIRHAHDDTLTVHADEIRLDRAAGGSFGPSAGVQGVTKKQTDEKKGRFHDSEARCPKPRAAIMKIISSSPPQAASGTP